MSATAAAIAALCIITATVVLVMAVGVLLRRVQALKAQVAKLSEDLNPALASLQSDSDVTRRELAALQDALDAG